MASDALGANELRLKLTIAVEENPDLYLALRDIKDPRRRTRRLKDLAVKGLFLERASLPVAVGLATREPEVQSAPAFAGPSVRAMLDWGDSTVP